MLMSHSFSWKTKFKSIIIVDGELFSNEYSIKLFITPYTANLKEQTEYFDRLKNLFEMVMANTITTWKDDPLYHMLLYLPLTTMGQNFRISLKTNLVYLIV